MGIAVCSVSLPHCYWKSCAIWDHTVSTCHLAEVTFSPLPKLVLEGCKAELT